MSIDETGFFRPTTRLPPSYRRPTTTRTTPTTVSATSRSSSAGHNAEPSLSSGDFAEATNIPSSGDWIDYTDIENATPSIQKATHKSKAVIGVVKTNENLSAHVVHAGVVFAWIVRGALEPPLSGIYEKSINGLFDSHVVIDVHPDNSFTMAATHDSELVNLKQRLDALTLPPS